MIIGMILHRLSGNGYPSPSFPRGGLAALFAIEVFDLAGSSPNLQCTVEHKNAEDTSFTSAGVFATMTTVDVHTLDLSGLKEEIRFVFTVGGTPPTNAVHFNVLAPAWRPY